LGEITIRQPQVLWINCLKRRMTTKVGRYASDASVCEAMNRAQWYLSWYQWGELLRAFQSLRIPVRAPKLLICLVASHLSRQRPRVRVPSSPPFLSSTCRELAILLMVQFGPVRPVSRLCRAPGALVCFELPVLLHSSLSVQIERDPTRRVVSARSRPGPTAMSLIMEVVAHRRPSSVGP